MSAAWLVILKSRLQCLFLAPVRNYKCTFKRSAITRRITQTALKHLKIVSLSPMGLSGVRVHRSFPLLSWTREMKTLLTLFRTTGRTIWTRNEMWLAEVDKTAHIPRITSTERAVLMHSYHIFATAIVDRRCTFSVKMQQKCMTISFSCWNGNQCAHRINYRTGYAGAHLDYCCRPCARLCFFANQKATQSGLITAFAQDIL